MHALVLVASYVDSQGGDNAQKEEDGPLSDCGGSPEGIDGQHYRRHRMASVDTARHAKNLLFGRVRPLQ